MDSEMRDSTSCDNQPDFSEEFYRKYADQYAKVFYDPEHAKFVKSSHEALREEVDLLDRLMELVSTGKRGLDAGCATARDTYYLWKLGCDIRGVDAVEENIQLAQERYPDIADRLSVADLRLPLEFPDEDFDFIICNAVIQHIRPEDVFEVTLREFARVLRPGGVLQLMFKNGDGVITIYDPAYEIDRTFQLYDEHELLVRLNSYGLSLIEVEEPNRLGGIMYFSDPKPMEHCVFYVRKEKL